MLKIKFLGKSDLNFEHGDIYTLAKFETTNYQFKTWLVNKGHKLIYIPYSSIHTFNANWKIVE